MAALLMAGAGAGKPTDVAESPAASRRAAPATQPRARVLVASTTQFPRNGEGDLLLLKSGELIYVYGQWPGVGDLSSGARIAVIRSRDNGLTWSQPQTLFAEEGYDLYHASLARLKDGRIGLTYTKRKSRPSLRGEKVFRHSADEGAAWSEEILISDGQWRFYQTSACDRLVVLSSGRLVHPVSRADAPSAPDKSVATLVYASDDGGRTWQRKTPQPLAEPDGRMFHEASIVEYAPGKLLLLARTRTGRLWESRSDDGGDTWSVPRATDIGAPAAPPWLSVMPGGKSILLIWNPTPSKGILPRDILASQISDDGGRTWRNYREIERISGVISYASGTWTDDTLHLVYTEFLGPGPGSRGFQARYLTLERKWLEGRDAP